SLHPSTRVGIKLNSEPRCNRRIAASSGKSRIIDAQHNDHAVAHQPLVDCSHRNLTQAIPLSGLSADNTEQSRSAARKAEPVSIIEPQTRSRFETLRCGKTGSGLAGENKIDPFRRR